MSPTIEFDGHKLLDGGICDPIPISKAILDGMLKNVIILTRDEFYRKGSFKYGRLAKKIYNKNLSDVLSIRHKNYNDTLEFIEQLEVEKKAFVIRPSVPLKISKFERNQYKLEEAYNAGYMDAMNKYKSLMEWLCN